VRTPTERQLRSSLQDLNRSRLARQFEATPSVPIADAPIGEHVEIHGEVREVRIVPVGADACFEAAVTDGTGEVHAHWPGVARPCGVHPGASVRLIGTIEVRDGSLVVDDPFVRQPLPED